MRSILVVLALLAAGCNRPPAALPRLYESAREDLRSGKLAGARAKAGEGVRVSERLGDRLFQTKFTLLGLEAQLYGREAKTVLAELDKPLPAGTAYNGLRARQTMLRGYALVALGRLDEAGPLLDESARLAGAAGDTGTVIESRTAQGARLLRLRKWPEAEQVLDAAVRLAAQAREPYLEAGALLNLGMGRMRRQRYDEAAALFERAAAAAGPHGGTLLNAAESNLASCYYRLGEFDRAGTIQSRAIQAHEKSGATVFLQQSLGEAGTTFLLNGQPDKAVPYFERSLKLAGELRRTCDAAIWAGNLSSAYTELADWDNAARTNGEARHLKSGGNCGDTVYNTLNDARIRLGRGQTAEAVKLYRQALAEAKDSAAVQWEANAGLGGAAARAGDAARAEALYQKAIGIVERTRSDLLRTEFKLPFLTRLIRLYQADVELLMQRHQAARALEVADSSRGQVLAEGFGVAANGRTPVSTLVRLARERKLVLVSYWLADPHSYGWVVDGKGLRSAVLPPQKELEPLVRRYRSAVEERLVDPLAAKLADGEALYRALLEPLVKGIPSGARVVIVPDGVLHGLNLEMLPVPGERPGYWIERATVSIAPSLALLTRPAAEKSAHGMLLLGDPVNHDPNFAPLAQAGQEVERIRAQFDASTSVVLTREQATAEAFRHASPGRFANIHFTSHATANYQSPLDSAVILSNGKLYARDIMELPLNAELVTVSACRGVGVRAYSGEGLVGFSWAFLRAGARHVIAGMWDVNDASTALLMGEMYGRLARGEAPEAALRQAKLVLLAQHGNFRKPYYWAPFQIYSATP